MEVVEARRSLENTFRQWETERHQHEQTYSTKVKEVELHKHEVEKALMEASQRREDAEKLFYKTHDESQRTREYFDKTLHFFKTNQTKLVRDQHSLNIDRADLESRLTNAADVCSALCG